MSEESRFGREQIETASLTNFAAEREREKARQRTYDAMLRKAKAGHVASGKVYASGAVPCQEGGRSTFIVNRDPRGSIARCRRTAAG